MQLKRKLIWWGALLFCHSALSFDSEEWRSDGEANALTNVIVSSGYISVPLGRVLLVKFEDGVCSIKFKTYSRDRDRKPGNIFHSGAETFHAEYEWFYIKSEDNRHKQVTTLSGNGKLKDGATIGIGRFIFPLTSGLIHCDKHRLTWNYPMYIAMFLRNDTKQKVYVSPTGWSEFSEVKVNNDNLTWYTFQEKRGTEYIPVASLPR